MSEGRTPTATIAEQRRLEQDDIDILHQIVIRAQNDPISQERPKDALLEAYGEVFDERRLNQHQDRACFDVLLKLLNPATPGESLYHKFEHILHEEGILLAYDDDDATTQDAPVDERDRHSDGISEHARPVPRRVPQLTNRDLRTVNTVPNGTQPVREYGYYPTQTGVGGDVAQAIDEEAYLDSPPPHISQLLQQAEARDRAVLGRQTLDAWRNALQTVKDRQLDARADALYALRLKRKVLKQCLAVFQDLRASQQRADEIYCRRLASNALGKTSDEYRVRRVASIDDDRIKALSLYKWTIASREAMFVSYKDLQVKRTIFRKLVTSWKEKQAQQVRLEEMLQMKITRNNAYVIRSALSFLVQKTEVAHENEMKADFQNQTTLHYASINAWRLKMGKLNDLAITAEDAREYFLMRRVLKRLQNVLLFRKDRRTWLATWAARKWKDLVKSRKHHRYDEVYRQLRRTIKLNMARRMLLRWQQKWYDQREDNARADATYQASIMNRVMRPMVETTYDRAAWVKKNEVIADRKADHHLEQRALVALQMKQQSLVDMSNQAERLQQYRTEQRAVQGMRQMQMKAFELHRRQLDADAFRIRHDKRGIRNTLARMRVILAERRSGEEGALKLLQLPAVTPAKKREELLLNNSTRLSTTPAYTPFVARLRQEARLLEDIEDDREESTEGTQTDLDDVDTES